MTISTETLMAYVDGELDAAAAAEVEAAAATDSGIARQLEQQQALRARIGRAMNAELNDPMPEKLLQLVRDAPAGVASVVDAGTWRTQSAASRQPRSRMMWPNWMGFAASVVVGILVGSALFRGAGDASLTLRDGRLLAQGVLGKALSTQLASTQAPDARIQIGLSFRDHDGNYCRSFVVRDTAATAGLACRSGESWAVQATAPASVEVTDAAGLRMAASSLPAEISQAVDARIDGSALDATAEKQAQLRGWRD
jgi:hypothetical protein